MANSKNTETTNGKSKYSSFKSTRRGLKMNNSLPTHQRLSKKESSPGPKPIQGYVFLTKS